MQNLPRSSALVSQPVIVNSHETQPGVSHVRFGTDGSSILSPGSEPKGDIKSETRSTSTSRPNMNEIFNYANDGTLYRRGQESDEDRGSISSVRRGNYRIVRREVGNNPEETERKMNDNVRAALDYQSQISEWGSQGSGSVSGSGSSRRRHRRRHGSGRGSDQ